MAGEIQEPFRLNFQADVLHSGSISFGRFESESLSWERRSIFSHNRYLEEVEKYSKPGTVTEKKAYFEAEFKRKALLKQRASESQDGGVDSHDFEESGLGNNGETEIQHYEKEDAEALYSESANGSTRYSESQEWEFVPVATLDEPVKDVVDCTLSIPERLMFDETHQSETEDVVGITEKSIAETLTEKVILLDVESKANDSSFGSQTPKKDDVTTSSGNLNMSSSKVKPASEKKLARSTPNTHAKVDRFQKVGYYEASKSSMTPRTTESKVLHVKKTEKKSPQPATPFISSRIKTSKAEDAKSIKEKELRLKKSIVKDIRSDKTVKPQFPLSEKCLPGLHSTANRPKQIISSGKAHVIQSPASYSLKVDQRAESRKELYMKIAEKSKAREVKANQVEAKILEKQEARIKQLRRSLNFKATPMPSFYNESTRGSDQHKVTPISKTVNQRRPGSQSMATRQDKNAPNSSVPLNIRPSSSSTARLSDNVKKNHLPENTVLKSSVPLNIKRPSSSYSSTNRFRLSDSHQTATKNAFNSSVGSYIRPSSATISTNRPRLSESIRRDHISEKKSQEKKKVSNITNQKQPEQRLVKKHVPGMHAGSGTKSGNLLVC